MTRGIEWWWDRWAGVFLHPRVRRMLQGQDMDEGILCHLWVLRVSLTLQHSLVPLVPFLPGRDDLRELWWERGSAGLCGQGLPG